MKVVVANADDVADVLFHSQLRVEQHSQIFVERLLSPVSHQKRSAVRDQPVAKRGRWSQS